MKTFEEIKKKKKQDVINMCIDALNGGDKDAALMHAIKCLQAATVEPKNSIEWVGLAKAKQDVLLSFLRYMHSDGCDLVASDGYRMHILKGVGIEKGYYESEQFAAKYWDHTRLLELPWRLVNGGVEYDWLWHKRVCKIDGLYFDASYINDAVSLMSGEIHLFVCDKSVKIECADMVAIVSAVHT